MSFGFIYLLSNPSMPGLYKIGCTERAPHQRVYELSSATAVPTPFVLMCYIEVDGMRDCETALHRWLSDFRVNQAREFFAFHRDCKPWLHGLFQHHPNALSYAEVDVSPLYHADIDPFNPWTDDYLEVGPRLPHVGPLEMFELSEAG